MLDTPGVSFSIANVVIPKSGPKTVPATLDFTGVDEHLVDLSQLVETYKIEYVQTVYIDNSNNPDDLSMTTDLTNQKIIAPAGSQGYYSLLQPNPPKLTFRTTAGAFTVGLQFLNVPVQPCVWGGAAGGTVGGLTDAQLRATPVPVDAGFTAGLTDTELRATPVPVSGPVTDVQLRAAPVPVSGPVTDVQLRAAPVPVSGPVTDVQLRAAPVPVSGPVTDAQLRAAAVPVSGPLTDAQLRASAISVIDAATIVDRTLAMTGGNDALVAAGQASNYLMIYNPVGNANVNINLAGGDPAVNFFVLAASGSFTMERGMTNSVHVKGTGAQSLICFAG